MTRETATDPALMADKQQLRRKYSSVDLQQVVSSVDVYRRPLNSSSGKSGALIGLVHEAAVATTRTGQLFLIEKGVPKEDDINYKIKYREGECRIAQVTSKDIRDWRLVRPVKKVNPGVTLEDLFDACGSVYSFLTDNCWNGTQRMRAAANEAEDGLTWQTKGAIGVAGVAVAAGLGVLLYRSLTGGNKRKEDLKS